MSLSFGQRAVVVDASVAVEVAQGDASWHEEWQAWTTAGSMVLAPAHFPLEVANALLKGRGADAVLTLALLEALFGAGYEVADRGRAGLTATVRLAERHGLTVYDAAYLDLVLDVDGALATLDRELAAAAEAEGVELVRPA